MLIRKPMNRKALLAIAFAGSVLNSQLPALSENDVESTDSVIQRIDNNALMKPEIRAYWLMRLASAYLERGDKTKAEAQYQFVTKGPQTMWKWEAGLALWANQTSLRSSNPKNNNKNDGIGDSHPVDDESSVLANTAIKKALTQLEKTSNQFAKLNLYFIASRLFEKMGNAGEVRRCNEVLEGAFKSCEGSSPVDEQEVKAAYSVLDSMSYGLIPVQIPNLNPAENLFEAAQLKAVPPFTDKDFEESERIKLRAEKIADRLAATNDLRRKAHRDLALWYMRLGKTAKSEQEKQILFGLVGIQDDHILYAIQGACGHLIWWTTENKERGLACGMG